MSRSLPTEPRRYLIAIGSPSCPGISGLSPLEQVKNDVEKVTELFKQQGYEQVLSDQIYIGVTSQNIKTAVGNWFASSKRRASDCVIIYYGGHGDEGGRFGDHYLFTVESNEKNLSGTAIRTQEFVQLLFPSNKNQPPRNVLLILDVCYANTGAKQMFQVLSQLKSVASEGSGFWMISSSDDTTMAGDGDFVEALCAAMHPEREELQQQGAFLSIDFLIGRINQHFQENQQAQKAIANAHGVLQEAIIVRNPRFNPLRNRLASLDLLIALLKEIEWQRLMTAYQRCYSSMQYPAPGSIEALLLTLIDLPQGIEQRLPTFISFLVLDATIQSELRQSLEAWAQKNLPDFATVKSQAESAVVAATEFQLMIYVRNHQAYPGRYAVQACWIKDPNPDHSNSDYMADGERLSTSESGDTGIREDEILSIVAQLVSDCAKKVAPNNIAPSDFSVQCFLPKPLLHLPIEQAKVDNYGDPVEICHLCKAVVVRSSERQQERDRTRLKSQQKPSPATGNWQKRWRSFLQCRDRNCQDVLVLHQGDCNRFRQELEDYSKVGCGFSGVKPDPANLKDPFTEVFLKGVSIAFWLRPGHSAADPGAALESVLEGCIANLPATLTERRKCDYYAESNQERISQHIALMWDNPFRPFPDDDWTGRSA